MLDAGAFRASRTLVRKKEKSSSQLPMTYARGGKSVPRQVSSHVRLPPLAIRTARLLQESCRQLPKPLLLKPLESSCDTSAVKEFAFVSKQGRLQHASKAENQDACLAVKGLAGQSGLWLFAVFDGHGPFGQRVSAFLKENFQACVEESLSTTHDSRSLAASLKSGFQAVCKGLRRTDIDCTYSGSTCLGVIVSGSACVCAYVGDSRAVVGREKRNEWKAKPISVDHRPTQPEEYSRIVNSGGAISPCYNSSGTPRGPLRVWLKNQHFPGLAMTRSIGDSIASQAGVSSEPQVTEFQLTPRDKFLVLATDGLWEVCTNEDVVSFVGRLHDSTPSQQACEALMREAANRWVRISESRDDVTIVVVYLA